MAAVVDQGVQVGFVRREGGGQVAGERDFRRVRLLQAQLRAAWAAMMLPLLRSQMGSGPPN